MHRPSTVNKRKQTKTVLNNMLVDFEQGTDFFTEGSVIMDYCDVLISCLVSHSDGTHSLQRINLVNKCDWSHLHT